MDLHDTIAAGFPIVANNDLAMLELVRSVERHGYVYLVLRSLELEHTADGTLRVRDIRRRAVRFVPSGEPTHRVERYLDAIARVLERLLGNPHFAGARAIDVFATCPLCPAIATTRALPN